MARCDAAGNQLRGSLPLSWATDLDTSSGLSSRRDYWALRRRGRHLAAASGSGADEQAASGVPCDGALAHGSGVRRSSGRRLTQIGSFDGSDAPPPPSPPPPAKPSRERGMHSIRLAGNQLTGPLPAQWLRLASQELDLSGNQLSVSSTCGRVRHGTRQPQAVHEFNSAS